jgi:hypothetical protein
MTPNPPDLVDLSGYSAPGMEWQAATQELITICRRNLFAEVEPRALKYLQSRSRRISRIVLKIFARQ